MAAGLHGNPQQEEILRLVLSGGADPGTRNLENQLPAHLLQSGTQGEQVSRHVCIDELVVASIMNQLLTLHLLFFQIVAQAYAEETKRFISSARPIPARPGMI